MTATAVVINVHALGATVRLSDGTLAAVPSEDLAAHRAAYLAAYQKRSGIELVVRRRGRHATATFPKAGDEETLDAPASIVPSGPDFEEQMGAYLKATQEWAPPDRPDPAERHFIRKKRRAAFFEARNT